MGFDEVAKHVEYVLATQPDEYRRSVFVDALRRNVPGRGGDVMNYVEQLIERGRREGRRAGRPSMKAGKVAGGEDSNDRGIAGTRYPVVQHRSGHRHRRGRLSEASDNSTLPTTAEHELRSRSDRPRHEVRRATGPSRSGSAGAGVSRVVRRPDRRRRAGWRASIGRAAAAGREGCARDDRFQHDRPDAAGLLGVPASARHCAVSIVRQASPMCGSMKAQPGSVAARRPSGTRQRQRPLPGCSAPGEPAARDQLQPLQRRR